MAAFALCQTRELLNGNGGHVIKIPGSFTTLAYAELTKSVTDRVAKGQSTRFTSDYTEIQLKNTQNKMILRKKMTKMIRIQHRNCNINGPTFPFNETNKGIGK